MLKGENASLVCDADKALERLLTRLTALEFSAARRFWENWGNSLTSTTLRSAGISVHGWLHLRAALPPLDCPCLNTVCMPSAS